MKVKLKIENEGASDKEVNEFRKELEKTLSYIGIDILIDKKEIIDMEELKILVDEYFMDEFVGEKLVDYKMLRRLLLDKSYKEDGDYYIFLEGFTDYEVLKKDFDLYFKNKSISDNKK